MKDILIVDDSPLRRMVRAALSVLPEVRFAEASSGLEAIEQLSRASARLMILDLNMPDLHGLEVLHFVRRHQAYRNLPIIVLTTRGDEESRAAAQAAGTTLYITKPFAPHTPAASARVLLTDSC
ncbi:MAG TPA: response regulator [Blastocatellia bacterium]|nr:response regulator [Blastocatellia bacterium]HMV83802.1 response regulator [Blastocatellia bacterium]HMX28424.1 response regulator [Blastocatellia bacterium]HMZ20029.1 response regulator [Blastocatellia bacterium]HNG33524.1 response regulator [Blastocatellia bacterium]